ncbi:MAG: NUDIX hydrolase [Candidatus Thorarchaeota archaeon]|jgi:8-oxo-dGTP pyrophosphatase MutT (NUDIX family)
MSIKTTNVYVVWKSLILLIRRSRLDENKPGWWESPAGHVDIPCYTRDSSRLRKEALRELFEESGIVAHIADLIYLPNFSNTTHSSYLLLVSDELPPIVRLSDEHESFRWVSLNDSGIHPIREECKTFIKQCSTR